MGWNHQPEKQDNTIDFIEVLYCQHEASPKDPNLQPSTIKP